MIAVWEENNDTCMELDLIIMIKLLRGSDGSDIFWKVIPQQCHTVAETVFKKSVQGLGRKKMFFLSLSPWLHS